MIHFPNNISKPPFFGIYCIHSSNFRGVLRFQSLSKDHPLLCEDFFSYKSTEGAANTERYGGGGRHWTFVNASAVFWKDDVRNDEISNHMMHVTYSPHSPPNKNLIPSWRRQLFFLVHLRCAGNKLCNKKWNSFIASGAAVFFFTKAARAARKLGGGGWVARMWGYPSNSQSAAPDFVEKTCRKKGASSKKYKTTLEENIWKP